MLILLDLLAYSDNINQKDLLTWLGTLSVDLQPALFLSQLERNSLGYILLIVT